MAGSRLSRSLALSSPMATARNRIQHANTHWLPLVTNHRNAAASSS
jgi:hypothetical protein